MTDLLIPQAVPKLLRIHGLTLLKLFCPHSEILTDLVVTGIGSLLMDTTDNVTLCLLHGLGII